MFLTYAIGSIFIDAEIAQLVEQRIRNAWVEGSSPFFGLGFGAAGKRFFAGSFCVYKLNCKVELVFNGCRRRWEYGSTRMV